jgi:hypothetical protein
VTPSLDHFYSEEPRRQRSRESDFGVQWREEAAGPRFRVSWIEATGELYALRQDPSHMVELLGRVPRSGHPDPLRSDLIVEAVLAGWEHRCGQPGSLRWARDSVRAIEGEPLAPIDWSVRCLASCCPRPGTATALTDAAWRAVLLGLRRTARRGRPRRPAAPARARAARRRLVARAPTGLSSPAGELADQAEPAARSGGGLLVFAGRHPDQH